MKNYFLYILFLFQLIVQEVNSQSNQTVLCNNPPMGFMTWNYFADDITESDVKSIADAMVENGLVSLGYDHIFIDDGWQGGRDKRNNIIPDPEKFPSGIKALADYLHSKGMKLGIYSDAAQLTCGGYTASYGFEEQDAKTFADWGVDYLKYDYCGAPADQSTAIKRYKRMGKALQNSGRDIVFAVCEWGQREPWEWANNVGGHVWRTTYDIRDKWSANAPAGTDLHKQGIGYGILDILNINAQLNEFAGPGNWNDPDMLVVGLNGKKGPSGDLGGTGCSLVEYQSQMSLWCLMAAPLMISNDIRNMDDETRKILMNKDIIAIDQDPLGIQAERIINNDNLQVFLKPLENSEYAIGILNTTKSNLSGQIKLSEIGLRGKFNFYNVWSEEEHKNQKVINYDLESHQTLVLRLTKQN